MFAVWYADSHDFINGRWGLQLTRIFDTLQPYSRRGLTALKDARATAWTTAEVIVPAETSLSGVCSKGCV